MVMDGYQWLWMVIDGYQWLWMVISNHMKKLDRTNISTNKNLIILYPSIPW